MSVPEVVPRRPAVAVARHRIVQLARAASRVYRTGGGADVVQQVWRRTRRWCRGVMRRDGYGVWAKRQAPSPAELRRQRVASRDMAGPVVSLVVAVRRPDLAMFQAAVHSTLRQTYPHLELCAAVAEDTSPQVTCWLRSLGDSRVRVVPVAMTPRAADSAGVTLSRAALALANGEYVGFLGQHDRLAPSALFEMVSRLLQAPRPSVLYSDEDQITVDGRARPVLKPDWSPERLLDFDYLGGLSLLRRDLIEQAGGLRTEAAGAHHWDLLLRVTERTTEIRHLPRVLYHRAAPADSAGRTARDSSRKAQCRVLADALARRGVHVVVESRENEFPRARRPAQARPLVSIVIPTKDRFELISMCLDGLLRRTDYEPLEVILVDTGSTDPRVFELYRSLSASLPADRLRVVPFEGPFNYSRACNVGAGVARGELLLFLNNDIEIVDGDWLGELVFWGRQPAIGVVGAQLLYPDGRIQHAGVMLGLSGLTGHVFQHAAPDGASPFGTADTYRNVLAVTGACQLLRHELFRSVGGFDEQFRMTFSDLTLCLKLWRRGYRNLYTPRAVLVHHESATRPLGDSDHDVRLFVQFLVDNRIARDPYFHPQLDASDAIPRLRFPEDVGAQEKLSRWARRAGRGEPPSAG